MARKGEILRLNIQIDKALHDELVTLSEMEGVSMNQLIVDAFAHDYRSRLPQDRLTPEQKKRNKDIQDTFERTHRLAHEAVEQMDIFTELFLLFVRYYFAAHPRVTNEAERETMAEDSKIQYSEFIRNLRAAVNRGGNVYDLMSIATACFSEQTREDRPGEVDGE